MVLIDLSVAFDEPYFVIIEGSERLGVGVTREEAIANAGVSPTLFPKKRKWPAVALPRR